MSIRRAVLTILCLHFFLAGLLGLLSPSIPTDMLENLFWGANLEWSFEKHPPLTGAEALFFTRIFGIARYSFLAPLNAVILLYCVFLLSAKILQSEKKAFTAFVLCYGVFFHAFYFKFNANTANFGLFGLATLAFYFAVAEREYRLFVPAGLLSGLIMLTKYSGVMLIGCFFLSIILTKEGRRTLKSPFLYLGFAAFLGVLMPHIMYILKAEYSPLHYAIEQLNQGSRLRNTWRFFGAQIAFLLPFFLAFSALKPERRSLRYSFDSVFLASVGFLPILFTLLYQLLTAKAVGSFWLSMYYFLLPTACMYLFKTAEDTRGAFIIIGVFAGVLYGLLLAANLLQPYEDTRGMNNFKREFTSRYFSAESAPRKYICATSSSPRSCYNLGVFEPGTTLIIKANREPLRIIEEAAEGKLLIIGDFTGESDEYQFFSDSRIFEKKFRFKFAARLSEYCLKKPLCKHLTAELFAPNTLKLTIAIKHD